jgi:ribonuclease Z
MQFKVHGCRGSIPVAGDQFSRHGGNTTCIRVLSDRLPERTALILDAGSGLVPASQDLMAEGVERVTFLFTHYHWDHTIGLTLSPLMFMKHVSLVMGGPVQDGVGTREVCESLFRRPFFPVEYQMFGSHIEHLRFQAPDVVLILFHPTGGFATLLRERYETLVARGDPIPFDGESHPLEECLVISMHRANHPEHTVSYRLEEGPTGRCLALLTDHENQDGIPNALAAHLADATTLVADCQYTRETYERFTAGFGHGTPDYVVRLAREVGARKVLLTHHDPGSSDERLEAILEEACRCAGRTGGGGELPLAMARDGVLYDV